MSVVGFMKSRAEAGTEKITNSLKGLTVSLFRGFLPFPVPSSLRLCAYMDTTDNPQPRTDVTIYYEAMEVRYDSR